ncbi:hypothetical protein LTR37_014676 [Vermiconidia calcicola]|uniref:Uncharacterized protein n=1 Tax=Vermiconidia calcicola TaxID=1690605 RepID=A0ACC3MVP0_9PEZI|nr:hypothetical protein LTR37_014676 [Vermiconidia calcicola]
MSETRVFSRREIEARIVAGDTLIIVEDHVLRLHAWQDIHPGGRLVIQHMVGRDATDEVSIHRIGRVEREWVNFVPPIQGGIFKEEIKSESTDAILAWDSDVIERSTPSSSKARYSATSRPNNQREFRPAGRLVPPPGGDNDGGVGTSQAVQGWKINALPDSFTAIAIQEAIDADIARYPSLDAATQRNITHKFRALHQRVYNEGFYDCRISEYIKEVVRYCVLFGLFLFCLDRQWYILSGATLGIFWQQIMFTAHDAGHCGISHNFVMDSLIGIFIGNFCCGLSIGWWKSSHNVHHLVTNDPVHDPDTQNVPLFSISPAFFSSVESSYYNGFQFPWNSFADYAVRLQKWTYYPIMAVARFNLYYLSWLHLASRRSIKRGTAAWIRPTEIVAILCYVYLFFYLLLWRTISDWQNAAIFLFVSHLATLPLQIQITLSHWGTSTSDLGPTEAFAQRQLRTTMDVACPEWLDFVHGGLQFQTAHHLFPRVPRHNLRRLQGLVKDFCEETAIEYQILGFVDGNHHVLNKLQQITDQAKRLAAHSEERSG